MTDTFIIIPDIHERIDRFNKIESTLSGMGLSKTKRIYLGDWFDSFKRSEENTIRTCNLLAKAAHRGDILLWGNHDFHYSPSATIRVSGFSPTTMDIIGNILGDEIWNHFSLFHRVEENILISHAGFNEDPSARSFDRWIELIGHARGGQGFYGGPTWMDWEYEFVGLPGVTQIVGHTSGPYPRMMGSNLNLDTSLRNFAILTNSRIQIIDVR